MTGTEQLLQDPLAQAIGWALLHFVWQGALVGALAAAALAALRRSDADVRYTVAAIALAVMGTLPIVTATQTYNAAVAERTPVPVDSGAVVEAATRGTPAVMARAEMPSITAVPDPPSVWSTIAALRNVEPWIPAMVASWLAGVAVLTLRLFTGWIWVQRMKSHGAFSARRELQLAVARLSKRLHIYRPVRLLESSRVDVPTVIGWLKPVILLPVSALAGLSLAQVEAILAHELAHIRRHDYLVNLLQALLETLLFYHPAVWWLSGRIRAERENCCDDLAVNLCGDPVAYARALADLEALRGSSTHLAMAATGGHLLTRVRRLLLSTPAAHDGRGPVWVAGATALLLVFTIGVAVVTNASGQQPEPVIAAPSAIAAPPQQLQKPETVERAAFDGKTLKELEKTLKQMQAVVKKATPPSDKDLEAIQRLLLETEKALASPAFHADMNKMATELATVYASLEASLAEFAKLAPQVAPFPPTPPAAPAEAAVPAPPAPRDSQTINQRGNHITWSHNGEKLEVCWDGEFEFTDDDTDIKSMTAGSQVRISDGGWFNGRSIEFTADASGKITRRYWVGRTEHPFDPEGKRWLAQSLPRFVRQSAIGAKGRVARIHKASGVAGVLTEIGLISGSWAEKVYYTELLNLNLSADARRQALEQASRDLTSDYEMATLLISQSDTLLADAVTRKAFFDAARSIESDYEMRRVFSTGLKNAPVEPALLSPLLEAARGIDSDYELASLLVQLVKQQSIDPARASFFATLETVGSDYERGRVLAALGGRADVSGDTTAAMLTAVAAKSNSDYETANFLLKVAKQPLDAAKRQPFFAAVDGMRSDYDKGRVLLVVAGQPGLSTDTIAAVLTSVKAMKSSYEMSRVLQTLAANNAITGASRDAYIDVTEKLGDYEQGRALSALVKSDRARK